MNLIEDYSKGDDNMKLVRESFINLFVYYPHGEYKTIKPE
jgi:hypothetical protein